MSDKEIIIEYIENRLLPAGENIKLASDDNLLVRAPIDSMGVVQLVDFLEQSFGIKIRAGEVTIQNFQTVDAMFALIERKRAAT
jgi:acyl carrier protein